MSNEDMIKNKEVLEDEELHTTETLKFRKQTDEKLTKLNDKKTISILNWLTIAGIIIMIVSSVLVGMLYIVKAENAPLKANSDAIKHEMREIKEDVKEVKEEVKEVKKELKEVTKAMKSEEELKRIAKAQAREACVEYHIIRDGK